MSINRRSCSHRRIEIELRGDAVENLDVVNRDAITRLQIEPGQNFRRQSQHFKIGVLAAGADQLAAPVAYSRDAIQRAIAFVV